jgi:thiol-disulfide isomerase/thioredoxin
MKLFSIVFVSALLPLLFSCHASTGDGSSNKEQKPSGKQDHYSFFQEKNIVVDSNAILEDYKKWYSYTYNNVHLAQDFIGLDTDSSSLSKAAFLSRLTSGNFVPFKIRMQDDIAVYKLFKILRPNEDIQSTIKQMAETERQHFNMEGKELPNFDFTDLNGKRYNKVNTKGKTMVLKCWFIHCVACVKEFPELNKLVDSYQNKNDLLFVSLATDAKQDLTTFLMKKPFNYAVVPNQQEYIGEQLGLSIYPTHILVDKNGRILKVTNSINDLIPFIERQVGKNTL